jgi:hypothetical protein
MDLELKDRRAVVCASTQGLGLACAFRWPARVAA